MQEQWQELKDTIIELRDNDGTATQQEVCKFLVNLMEILENQVADNENISGISFHRLMQGALSESRRDNTLM